MGNIKNILRYSAAGLSQREIAAACASSVGTVNTVLSRINASGVKDPLALREHELGAIVYPSAKGLKGARTEPDMAYIHAEMQRPGVTLSLLWEEYKASHPDGLARSTFCARYHQFRKQSEIYMRKTYKSGDQMMVDWAGMTMTYLEMARYYGTAVLPARPFRPRDKGPVENGVKIAENKIIAPLRNRQFHSFPCLRQEVLTLLEGVNTMPFQKLPGNRRELFEKTDRQSLKKLPPSRCEFAAFKAAKVNFDYHVQYEGFYSKVWFNTPRLAAVQTT